MPIGIVTSPSRGESRFASDIFLSEGGQSTGRWARTMNESGPRTAGPISGATHVAGAAPSGSCPRCGSHQQTRARSSIVSASGGNFAPMPSTKASAAAAWSDRPRRASARKASPAQTRGKPRARRIGIEARVTTPVDRVKQRRAAQAAAAWQSVPQPHRRRQSAAPSARRRRGRRSAFRAEARSWRTPSVSQARGCR